MDYESEHSRQLGCWNAPADLTPSIEAYTPKSPTDVTADFVRSTEDSDFLVDIGFGKDVDQATRDFWREECRKNYSGDDGRRRARMATINLRDRDGLRGRLWDVTCPVLWLHVSDQPFLEDDE